MSTRNNIILIAAVVVVAALGVVGWNMFNEAMKNAKLAGPARDNFLKSYVATCSSKAPSGIDAEKFKQACVCMSEKFADQLTVADAKTLDSTGKLPDGMEAKMQQPAKDCVRSAGLAPAQ